MSKHTVLSGTVRAAGQTPDGAPLDGAFVRLLDGTGEFTAEVVSSASGQFRFFAAPGSWTIRALHPSGTGQTPLTTTTPGLFTVDVTVS